MITRLTSMLRCLRRRLARSEWTRRLLGLDRTEDGETQGLILIQIDGLAKTQFDKALADGRMPYLASLRDREQYVEHATYAGLPSTTPAVQGELFYGERTAVPAFQFRDHETGRLTALYSPETAQAVEQRLAQTGTPLLTGGAAYADIYTGGAREASFCAAALGLFPQLRDLHPLRVAGWGLLYLFRALPLAGLLAAELVLAVYDLAKGAMRGRSFWFEIAFLPKRVLVAILLRELVAIRAGVDAQRGVPVIHANFLGYDEQSHRRGPDSRFAHWTLKGIDRSIRSIARAARLCPVRAYDLWVYSDHGQEAAAWYEHEQGRTLRAAVDAACDAAGVSLEDDAAHEDRPHAQAWHRLLGGNRLQRWLQGVPGSDAHGAAEVAPMGPVAHVYLPDAITYEQRAAVATYLASEAGVPAVLHAETDGPVQVWRTDETGTLAETGESILGKDRENRKALEADLETLTRHPDAGDLVLLGWRPEGRSLTFANENGAHGGPGREETRGFLLAPPEAPLPPATDTHLRPLDLHAAIRRARDPAPRCTLRAREDETGDDTPPTQTVRVLSYNIHACVGLDDQHRPARIARVIARYNPDVVALQEVDRQRPRSDGLDHARHLAEMLEMHHCFYPSLQIEAGQYGNAVLSRYPLTLERGDALPGPAKREPRGALRVRVDCGAGPLIVINTHLGLSRRERLEQIDALLTPDWMGDDETPLVLCGDFNSAPGSQVYRRIRQRLQDACDGAHMAGRKHTWMGMRRIDYIFAAPSLTALRATIAHTGLARLASDHRPVVADLQISPRAHPGENEPPAGQ